MITPVQSKMARAALGWTVRDLAKHAKVTPNTVSRFESGKSSPNASTLAVIKLAFETAGVEFINGEAPGIRLRRSE